MTEPDSTPTAGIGGRVGSRVAGLVADATVSTRQRLAGHTVRVANEVFTQTTNHVSDEIRGVMGDLWSRLADDPETPETLRPLLSALATERGQAWAWIGGTATGAVLGAGLLGLLTNELAPVINPLIAANPHGLLTPADAAAAQARGIRGAVDTEYDMAAQGLDRHRQEVLMALSEATLAPEAIVELLRRGIIDHGLAKGLLLRNGFTVPNADRMLAMQEVPLSPPDAAAAWARSELTDAQTDAIGAKSGVSKEDMRILRALAGQPPSPEELLFAWRRGIIDESKVDRGLIQGPIRNEWLDVIKNLQWSPLPVGEAANAVNQGHMTLDQAEQVAKENGIQPDDFKVIVDNAGIPPGPQEALDWVNAGYITEAQFREIFLESRIKNKYIDLYLTSRRYILPPDTIRLLFSRGAFTQEEAIARLLQRGLSTEDAAAYIAGASAEKTAKSRDLTVAQVLDLRADGLITNDDALAMLQATGYDAQEALWVTELADLRRVSRFVTAAINRTKASYIAGRLSETEASTVIDRLGLPAEFKESAFTLWDLEKTTVTKGLTTAQVTAAVKNGYLTPEEGIARLTGQGYEEADAIIILRVGKAI